ncbi:MAG: TonB family protein [Candidatus Acidiferrales bacterium]
MKLSLVAAVVVLSMASTCFAQSSPALCPRHIESPAYPAIAHTAHVTGKVAITVTIDQNGKVIKTELAPGSKRIQVLDESAIENARHWTFANPPAVPYIETIVYDYELDGSLPPEGGKDNLPVVTKVTFDLPDHVNIRTNVPIVIID